jgi:hypothetical protein
VDLQGRILAGAGELVHQGVVESNRRMSVATKSEGVLIENS